MPTPKTTSQITDDNWLSIQHRINGGAAFTDTPPLDDLGGPGPSLVFENGIWKYPQQAVGGRFVIPDMRRPYTLVNVTFQLGASIAWTLNLKQNPSNTSGEPYDAADAALYLEGNVQVDSGTDQQRSLNYWTDVNRDNVVVYPGQAIWFGSAAVTGSGMVRMLLKPLYDGKG